MANSTVSPHLGGCVPPFLDVSTFPATGGFVGARTCLPVDQLPGRPICCLPCPSTDWIYADSFKTYSTVAEWLNVFGLCLLVFMLISFAVLPVSKTRSHYLSICLIISVAMVSIGFIIPLAAQPEQCFNEITPNDMFSSIPCAFSGAFIVGGCLCATGWICIRALSMNMQIVWDTTPGRKFLLASQIIGWGLPAGFFAATMAVTGVSFRFGSACHINHDNSLAVFWGPLLGTVALAGLLQLWTFGYCIKVYLSNLWATDAAASSTNQSSGGLPSYNGSVRTKTARAVFQRLKKVLFLQWRGLGIVSIILIDVIFCSIVFVHLDRQAAEALADFSRTQEWVYCLVAHPWDKNQCLPLVNKWLVNVETVEAVLLLLAFAGLQCFIMMTRLSFFGAWYELIHRKIAARREFMQIDARPPKEGMIAVSKQGEMRLDRAQQQQSDFEMHKPAHPPSSRSSEDTDQHILLQLDTKIPIASQVSTPDETYSSPYAREKETLRSPRWHNDAVTSPARTMSPPTPAITRQQSRAHDDETSDYFGSPPQRTGSERQYRPHVTSFSGLRTPSRQSVDRNGTWDARSVHSRTGLGVGNDESSMESIRRTDSRK